MVHKAFRMLTGKDSAQMHEGRSREERPSCVRENHGYWNLVAGYGFCLLLVCGPCGSN
jgi:hypothetical protein